MVGVCKGGNLRKHGSIDGYACKGPDPEDPPPEPARQEKERSEREVIIDAFTRELGAHFIHSATDQYEMGWSALEYIDGKPVISPTTKVTLMFLGDRFHAVTLVRKFGPPDKEPPT